MYYPKIYSSIYVRNLIFGAIFSSGKHLDSNNLNKFCSFLERIVTAPKF